MEDLPLRYLAGGERVDNWALSAFRRRHALALNNVFTQVLEMGRSMGLGKLGRVAIDSTRIKANANRDRVDTEQSLRNERAKLRRNIRRWQKACDQDDSEPTGLKVAIEQAERKLAELPQRLERLQKSGLKGILSEQVGKVLDLRQAAGGLQVAHQALLADGAQLGRRDELGQQVQRSFGLEVEAGFQARKDADEQVTHAGQALGLSLHDVAATADEQPDLEVEFGGWLDWAQVRPGSDLVGDGAGVARIGLVLAADSALPSPIDGNAWHMDEREPASASMAWAKPAMPPMTSRPMRTVPRKAVSSSDSVAISAGVLGSLRSICTAPSASMAVTQCISLAMSIPTLICMAPLAVVFGIPPTPSSPYIAMVRRA